MFRDTKSKLLKAVSVLLLVSGLFILFLVIAVFFNWEILEFFLPWFEATGTFISSYAFPGIGWIGWIFTLFFIIIAFIDLLCSNYIYRGNKIFWWVATIRSLFTTLTGVGMVFLSLRGSRIDYMSFIEAIVEGLIYFIYYGAIFILLILSREVSKKQQNHL